MRLACYSLLGCVFLAIAGLLIVVEIPLRAQTSSLFLQEQPLGGASAPRAPATLATVSWTFQPLPAPKQVAIHDLVTIVVEEKSLTLAEGSMERRKNTLYDAILKDWVILDGLKSIKPSPQSDGDPRIQGQGNQLYRAKTDLETRERINFTITAAIVDIRPNGNLVLEAHKMVRTNNEQWDYSLSGICRRQDILDNNIVKSEHIAELSVFKRERGHVRDGYRRGWFLRLMDTFHWF